MLHTGKVGFSSWKALFLVKNSNILLRSSSSKLPNNWVHEFKFTSHDSSVNIVTILRAGKPKTRGSILGTGKSYFSSKRIRTDYGLHLASYSMDSVAFFFWGKAIWTWKWPHRHPVQKLTISAGISIPHITLRLVKKLRYLSGILVFSLLNWTDVLQANSCITSQCITLFRN